MNGFVVYNVQTTVQSGPVYPTETKARMELGRIPPAHQRFYALTDEANYLNNVVFKKTVKNKRTGLDVQIDSNTPIWNDPSSSTYKGR